MKKVTPFGKEVRNARMEVGARLKDMADFLGISSAYLSAVETGSKRITDDLLQGTLKYFSQFDIETKKIKLAASQSQEEVVLNLEKASAETREVITAFARRFPSMDDQEVFKLFGKPKKANE